MEGDRKVERRKDGGGGRGMVMATGGWCRRITLGGYQAALIPDRKFHTAVNSSERRDLTHLCTSPSEFSFR